VARTFEEWWKERYQDGPIYLSDVKAAWHAAELAAKSEAMADQIKAAVLAEAEWWSGQMVEVKDAYAVIERLSALRSSGEAGEASTPAPGQGSVASDGNTADIPKRKWSSGQVGEAGESGTGK
jgi:hypothetical protein